MNSNNMHHINATSCSKRIHDLQKQLFAQTRIIIVFQPVIFPAAALPFEEQQRYFQDLCIAVVERFRHILTEQNKNARGRYLREVCEATIKRRCAGWLRDEWEDLTQRDDDDGLLESLPLPLGVGGRVKVAGGVRGMTSGGGSSSIDYVKAVALLRVCCSCYGSCAEIFQAGLGDVASGLGTLRTLLIDDLAETFVRRDLVHRVLGLLEEEARETGGGGGQHLEPIRESPRAGSPEGGVGGSSGGGGTASASATVDAFLTRTVPGFLKLFRRLAREDRVEVENVVAQAFEAVEEVYVGAEKLRPTLFPRKALSKGKR